MLESGYKVDVWKEQHGELKIKGGFSYQRSTYDVKSPGITPDSTYFSFNPNTVKEFNGEVQYSQNITPTIKALVGLASSRVYNVTYKADFGEITPDDQLIPNTTGTSVDSHFSKTTNSAFFDTTYAPLENITFFLGGRLDKPDGLDTAFGPRASVVVNATKATTLKLIASRGFRNPTIGEAIPYEPGPQTLHPEKLDSYESVVEQKIGDWGTLTGSVFYSDLSDVLLIQESPDLSTFYSTNFRGLTSKGLELDFKAQLEKTLQGYLTFSYAKARNKDTMSDFKNLPSYLSRGGISWRVCDEIVASPEVVFGSSTKTDTGYTFDSYFTSNMTFLLFPDSKGVNISASVYNIFDNDYARLTGGQSTFSEAINNGRQFRLQASWLF